jgi:Na+/melibiose symporter-like transporter
VLTLPFWLFSAVMPYILPDGLSQATLLGLFLIIRYVGSISNSFYTPAYQAVLYNLTPNVNERNKLIATDTYVDLLGVWLPSLFPFFVDYLPRTIPTRSIYLGGAIIFMAIHCDGRILHLGAFGAGILDISRLGASRLFRYYAVIFRPLAYHTRVSPSMDCRY